MPYLLNNCGRRIARIRTQHGYTQERLADALNIDRTHLSKIEAGKRTCSIDLFVQLSALFDVSLDYLILGKKEIGKAAELAADLDHIIVQLTKLRGKI